MPVDSLLSLPADAIDSYPSIGLIQAIMERTSSIPPFFRTTSLGIETTDFHGKTDQAFCHVISLDIQNEEIRNTIWRHSVLTATIATELNRFLHLGFQGEEFSAGLIHDWGRLLIASAFPDHFSQCDPFDFDESRDVLTGEDQILGSNHCDLGCWLAAHQGLPELFCDVIRHHHSNYHSSHLSHQHSRLVALTTTADHMANHYQRYGEIQGYDTTQNPGIPILAQCGIPDVIVPFNEIGCEVFQSAIAAAATLLDR